MKIHLRFTLDEIRLFCPNCSTLDEARGEMDFQYITGGGLFVHKCPHCSSIKSDVYKHPIITKRQIE